MPRRRWFLFIVSLMCAALAVDLHTSTAVSASVVSAASREDTRAVVAGVYFGLGEIGDAIHAEVDHQIALPRVTSPEDVARANSIVDDVVTNNPIAAANFRRDVTSGDHVATMRALRDFTPIVRDATFASLGISPEDVPQLIQPGALTIFVEVVLALVVLVAIFAVVSDAVLVEVVTVSITVALDVSNIVTTPPPPVQCLCIQSDAGVRPVPCDQPTCGPAPAAREADTPAPDVDLDSSTTTTAADGASGAAGAERVDQLTWAQERLIDAITTVLAA